MARSRVMSFMSSFKPQVEHREQRPAPPAQRSAGNSNSTNTAMDRPPLSPTGQGSGSSPTPRQRSNTVGRERSNSRPASMIGGYIPPVMDLAQDTIPELLPIFTLLNSHSNKLYQEGYFLKLNDLDVQGRPFPDRSWTECFAQLVGTVLSLWDAAALDAAGEEGEVAPSFINLSDASIKMIDTLQTRSADGSALANVLSVSTAGKNRYLLHFSSYSALTQWTSAIRLAMFENACLQEAYTGSLIAGKGKALNSIRSIMTKTVFQTEEWTRVRFGAGTPWRRCWCVIAPPDEKEVKAQVKAAKKTSAYSKGNVVVKGDIKFYDTSKVTKKTKPVATIRDAYSTYAVYPQSRALIDQSTLIKIEGVITIHASPEVTTEGFIFVMPEVHPAVSGFEMMLRMLFPIYDIFHLYGRPTKLIADTLDTRGLMFALPQERRYGYLEIFDVGTLIATEGHQKWSEREWRKKMKNLVSERVSQARENGLNSRATSRNRHRNSLPGAGSALRFADSEGMRSTPSLRDQIAFAPPGRTDSAPPGDGKVFSRAHNRSASETFQQPTQRRQGGGGQYTPSRLSHEQSRPLMEDRPAPPPHGVQPPPYTAPLGPSNDYRRDSSSEDEQAYTEAHLPRVPNPSVPHDPIAPPPAFAHQSQSRPTTQPRAAPELRRANSRMSSTTLSQLAAANDPKQRPVDDEVAGEREGTYADEVAQPSPRSPRNPYMLEMPSARQGGSGHNPSSVSANTSSSSLSYSPPDRLRTDHPVDRRPSPLSQTSVLGVPESPTTYASVSAPHLPLHSTVPQPTIQEPTTLPSLSNESQPARPVPNRAASSIARKPLPISGGLAASPSVVNKSIRRKAVESALANIQPVNYPASESDGEPRSAGGYSSVYSYESSSATNTRAPPLPMPPVRNDFTRTGVLKSTGGEGQQEVRIGDARYTHESTPLSPGLDLPNVDFGPTQFIAPAAPAGPKKLTKSRPKSQAFNNSGTPEPVLTFNGAQYTPEPDARPVTAPDNASNRRSVLWQPVAMAARPDSRQDLTPEQWVQQRTAPGNGRVTPVFPQSHNRQGSSTPPKDTRKRLSKQPPGLIQRQQSGDWSGQAGQSGSRPGSRGASAALAPSPTPDMSHRLSAREQEHVARATNTPLINLAANNQPRKQESAGGLVSAIAAREQEKQAMKAGRGSQAVQQAIAQRSSQYYDRRPSPGSPHGMQQGYDHGYQPTAYGPQEQYYQDSWGVGNAYRAHEPAQVSNRHSYMGPPAQPYLQQQPSPTPQYHSAQQTPSPGWRGHQPHESHDSYFNPNGYSGQRQQQR